MEALDQQAADGLAEQARALREREVSARELVEEALQRAEDSREALNAFRVICHEEALATAEEADRRLAGGEVAPLLGVPVAIKDDVDLGGHTTPFGCGGGKPAERDAEVVRRLREAGAIVIGKTHAPEVGQWHFTETPLHGATRNPWHTNHTPGGSSGGAAAAVAAGVVSAAVGSDGAGSIRIPAAWTGLVGLKPQRGRVSTWPDPEAFNGLSCYGPLTRSTADAALLLDAIRGNVPADLHRPAPPAEPFVEAATREPERLRVAISFATPAAVSGKVHSEHRAAVEAFGEQLTELGHEVFPADPDYGLVGPAIIPRGMAGVDAWLRAHGEDRSALEPRTRMHARFGRTLSGLPLRLSRAAEPALQRRLGGIFERCDVVLTPATAMPPPRIGALAGRGYWATSTTASAICPFAFAWNVVGWPAISVPAGLTRRACRSARSCSAARATRRRCSRSPPRSSAPQAAGPRLPSRTEPTSPPRRNRGMGVRSATGRGPAMKGVPMAAAEVRSFDAPDEVREFEGNGRAKVVQVAGHTVGLGTFEPGWKWSENVKPIAGTDSCQVSHLGYVLSGSMQVRMDDGSEVEIGAGDVVAIPPGHDAEVAGPEPCVMVDFGEFGDYAKRG